MSHRGLKVKVIHRSRLRSWVRLMRSVRDLDRGQFVFYIAYTIDPSRITVAPIENKLRRFTRREKRLHLYNSKLE